MTVTSGRRSDLAVLLHPVWRTAVFFVTTSALFQMIFTVAAPFQDAIETFFSFLGALVTQEVGNCWGASVLSQALLGGSGGVLVLLAQIALLFLMVSMLEGVGYMSRAAFLMDEVMSRAGLEGRAFVALRPSVARAVPGTTTTRTLRSARDRISTLMAAPLTTCSARLPVYVLLIGLTVPSGARIGPLGAQGTAIFALLEAMTMEEGARAGQPLFTAPVVAAIAVLFLSALQCFSTIGVMRRESGTWRWPVVAFVSMSVLAWGMAALARLVVATVT